MAEPPRGVLDAAPGPLLPAARDAFLAALDEGWADPSRRYAEGRRARRLLDSARERLAALAGVPPATLSLAASSAEALVTALAGVRHARRRVGAAVVAAATDRSVVHLAAGESLRAVPVDALGRVVVERYAANLASGDVAVAVLQSANGEVGTTQPVAEVLELCRRAGVPLLVDASASLGRATAPQGADVLVGDAASFGGPPLGLLAVREGTRFLLPPPRPEAEGGRGWAAPWLPTVVAAGVAAEGALSSMEAERALAFGLVDRVRSAAGALDDVVVVGDPVHRLPHVVTFSVLFADGESLVERLGRHGLSVASGSACSSSRLEPSHVLAAIGALTHGNVRLTLPLSAVAPTLAADVDRFVTVLPSTVDSVRADLGTVGL